MTRKGPLTPGENRLSNHFATMAALRDRRPLCYWPEREEVRYSYIDPRPQEGRP